MKILIAEDDFVSRKLMHKILIPYGECSIAFDGQIALDYFRSALRKEEVFDFVCLDIMMPEIDGLDVLKEMRKMEKENGIDESQRAKIIMTTALSDKNNVIDAARYHCDGYLVKPIDKKKLIKKLETLGLLEKYIS